MFVLDFFSVKQSEVHNMILCHPSFVRSVWWQVPRCWGWHAFGPPDLHDSQLPLKCYDKPFFNRTHTDYDLKKHLWKHLHQTCFFSGNQPLTQQQVTHFRRYQSCCLFFGRQGKASKVGCENPKPWGFMMIQLDVRIFLFKWVGCNHQRVFYLKSSALTLSPETCSLDQTLANHKEFWAKQQEFVFSTTTALKPERYPEPRVDGVLKLFVDWLLSTSRCSQMCSI